MIFWIRRHGLLVCGAVLLAMIGLSLFVGDMALPPSRVWAGLMGHDEMAAIVLRQIRLPRLLVAIEIGAALAASGVVMQAFFRNSLASPGLLGVSSGGAAGAVVAIGA